MFSQGIYDEAKSLYARAVAIGEKSLGLEHPDLAVWLNSQAALLYSLVSVGGRFFAEDGVRIALFQLHS